MTFKKLVRFFRSAMALPETYNLTDSHEFRAMDEKFLQAIKKNTASDAMTAHKPFPYPTAKQIRFFTTTDQVLERAREFAETFARVNGTVTADDVRKQLIVNGYTLGPASGSLFRTKKFMWTGGYVKSTHPRNKGRLLRVYMLAEED